MTVLPFLVAAAAAGTGSLLVRHHRGWSTALAVCGLLVMAVTAAGIGPSATVTIGGTMLVGSEWLRLYALLGSVVGLLLVLVDVTALHEPDVPGVVVLGLGAAVVALAIPDPGIAVVAGTAGGLAGILVAAPIGSAARAAFVGVRELRALAVAGSLAILATAWLARPLAELSAAPAVFGLVYLAFAISVAVRFGAIPFHLWAARVADAAPGIALPLLMAWGPAAFAAVALTWIDQSVAPLALPLGAERAVVAVVGAISIVLGLVAAWIQDDLEHVVGYTIAADAGFAVLGLAVLDPAVWEPGRTWLLVFVVGRSAFAAWAVALHGAFGTRRLPELEGWARRAPVLAVALVVIAGASVGWPGLAAWEVRWQLAGLALPDVVAFVIALVPLAAVAIYARLLSIGLRPVGSAVRHGTGERPVVPPAGRRRRTVGALTGLGPAVNANRRPMASVTVLALAVLALVVAGGGLGVREASGAVPEVPAVGLFRDGVPDPLRGTAGAP